MQTNGIFPEQLENEDLAALVLVALEDEVVQSLLKTGEIVTQVSYLSLSAPYVVLLIQYRKKMSITR